MHGHKNSRGPSNDPQCDALNIMHKYPTIKIPICILMRIQTLKSGSLSR